MRENRPVKYAGSREICANKEDFLFLSLPSGQNTTPMKNGPQRLSPEEGTNQRIDAFSQLLSSRIKDLGWWNIICCL